MKNILQYNKEIADFKAAIDIDPNDAKAHHNLGVTYAKQGKSDLAVEAYQAAIDIDPSYAKAHYNLGNAYGRQDKSDLAIEAYQAAIDIDPSYAKAHRNLGNAGPLVADYHYCHCDCVTGLLVNNN